MKVASYTIFKQTVFSLKNIPLKRIYFFALLFFTSVFCTAQKVVAIKVDGDINPVAQNYIHRGIEKATDEKAQCLIIHLNTPGGLLTSMRNIVGDILESAVPVIVYVSPGGARAGSAGVFITLAANIAAMAPGTNIGAAHPVAMHGNMDSVMNTKVMNDAAAFIRTIAEKRNHNVQWAEKAVRQSLSLTETEALDSNVINLIAKNTNDLLNRINGKEVQLASGTAVLHTANAKVENVDMDTSETFLNIISDPNIMYILMMLGIFGILFELFSPGAIFPGIIGFICLILAFYSMSVLPINYAGLALIIFAIILFILEIKITSHGLLMIGGIVSLLIGSMMLIKTGPSFNTIQISHSLIFISVAIAAVFFIFVIGMGLRAQRPKPVTGIEGLIGQTGEAMEILNPAGLIKVHGELWKANAISGKVEKGERVRILAIKDLTLNVEQITFSS